MKMSTESAPKKLTPADPVDRETLSKLDELEQARNRLGQELLDLEQAKVRVVAAGARLDEQRHRIFEKVLMDRGLAPNAPAEVDAQTGKIIVHQFAAPAEAEPQPQPNGTTAAAQG
jgi:hypothetical protein